MNKDIILEKEKKIFDNQIQERLRHGFIPDLRRLRKVGWFYNNMWRDPEFVKLHWMPKVNFVIDIAKKRGGKVVELGCGCGYLTLELARHGLDVLGVDISTKNIAVARKYQKLNTYKKGFGSLQYKCCDIENFDFGKNQLDTVVFFRSLHHLKNIISVLRKIRRSLRKGGNIIICEPMRNNFTRKSAEVAGILRAVSPTWISYGEKLRNLTDGRAWDKYVNRIYQEYTYSDDFKQSPMDNKIATAEIVLKAVRKYFIIKKVSFSDAFIDKLIGGLRGRNKYAFAKFFKFLDNLMVERGILPPTEIAIYAKKK